jgi:flagellar M-ring protein FliF
VAELTLTQMRSLRDLPGLRQLLLLLGIAAAVAAGVSAFMWAQRPAAAPLYANLSAKDSADVADALRAANVPFQVDSGSGAITVTADKVYEARLKLASQGLPKGSGMGFEMIQKEQGFGTSQFIETARYQHALETELGRTISSLQSVQNAQVHLAVPKASAFARANDSSSGSVLVELSPGRSLDAGQVDSIVHLVASSVPDLAPGNVAVIDQYGHLLSHSGNGSDPAQQAASQFEAAHRVEADYVRRIEQLLTPMTGPGRVSAQVVADMDFSQTEEASETYKPDPAALRSEQVSINTSGGGAAAANPQGVPGATSNQPATAAQAQPLNSPAALAASKGADAKTAANADEMISRNSTRNFEMDKTVSHTRKPGGDIRRLSVAVLVDNLPRTDAKGVVTSTALAPAELAKVEALVKQAVGFDAKRGDTLNVQNAAFITDAMPAIAEIPLWQRPLIQNLGRQGLGAVVVLILIFAVLRPTLKSLMHPQPPRGQMVAALPRGAQAVALMDERAVSDVQMPQAIPEYEQKLALARGAVAQDPKRVAQVIKTWVGSDG